LGTANSSGPASTSSSGSTSGVGNASSLSGTNSAGTAGSSGGALRANGTVAPGTAGPTVTQEQNSDATIDAENRKLDRKVKSICKGC
jgi:hypothetical protein